MIDYTFHSHTFRCGHAEGDVEDYVLLAIKHGLKIYGVSDHVFLPGVIQPHTRGDYSYLEDYISIMRSNHSSCLAVPYNGIACYPMWKFVVRILYPHIHNSAYAHFRMNP